MPRPDESEDVRLRNTSNHQIDMCPLYGNNAAQTDALRLRSDASGRRGRLKSQKIDGEEWAPFLFENGVKKPEFAAVDDPLGVDPPTMPPAQLARIFAFGGDRANAAPHVAMLNTLFLREHNRLAGLIEAAQPGWDDERVFQTARNTVIVEFIQIVGEEYINHISGEVFQLQANPVVAHRARWNRPNWMTTEFSLLYRWHSLIPDHLTWGGTPYDIPSMLRNNARRRPRRIVRRDERAKGRSTRGVQHLAGPGPDRAEGHRAGPPGPPRLLRGLPAVHEHETADRLR